MAKLRNLLTIILIAFLSACGGGGSGGGNGDAGKEAEIKVGAMVKVTLNIEKEISENRPIRGYRVKIDYDESKVTFNKVTPTPPTAILRQLDNGSEVIFGSIATTDIEPNSTAILLFNVNAPGLDLSSFSILGAENEINSAGGVVMTNTASFSLVAVVQ